MGSNFLVHFLFWVPSFSTQYLKLCTAGHKNSKNAANITYDVNPVKNVQVHHVECPQDVIHF